jgi:hypothetical protein
MVRKVGVLHERSWPSGQTPDSQVKTPASSSQKISQLDLQQSSLGASTTKIDLQDQKSSTSAQHSGKESGEQMEFQNLIYLQAASYGQSSAIHHHIQDGRQNNKAK